MAEKCIIEQGTHHIPISQVCDIRNMYLSQKYYFKNTMFRFTTLTVGVKIVLNAVSQQKDKLIIVKQVFFDVTNT